MISIEQFKKLLGKKAETLTDTQIEELRADMYVLVRLALKTKMS